MKTLQEVKNILTQDEIENLNILLREIDNSYETEEEIFNLMDICKFTKQNFRNYNRNTELFHKIGQLDKDFFKYIESKVNKKNAKKQWQSMIDYLLKLKEYFDISDNSLVFDDFEDYFLYSTMNSKTPLPFKIGIEGWFFFKLGLAQRNLKQYDMAIESLHSCLKCSPMTFWAYVELLNCYLETNNLNEFKQSLDKSHTIVKSSVELGYYYYYSAIYYYKLNNYQVAKSCVIMATKFELNFVVKNKLAEIFKDITESKNILTNIFITEPEKVLIKNNIPVWYSEQIMIASLVLYKACVTKAIVNNQILNSVKKKLELYNLDAYKEQIDTNEFTDETMYLFENYKISVKLNKKWKLRYRIDNSEIKQGSILEAIDGNNTVTIVIDKNLDNLDFETLYYYNITNLKISGFTIINENNFTNINKKNIKTIIVDHKNDQNIYMVFTYVNNFLIIVSSNITTNIEDTKKELLKITDSINTFNSINHQFY